MSWDRNNIRDIANTIYNQIGTNDHFAPNSYPAIPGFQEVYNFYKEQGRNSSHMTLQDVWDLSIDVKWQEFATFIPWLFPSDEPSQHNPQGLIAPVVEQDFFPILKEDEDIKLNVDTSFSKILEMMGLNYNPSSKKVTKTGTEFDTLKSKWIMPGSQFYLSLSRILSTLMKFDFKDEARALQTFLESLKGKETNIPDISFQFWKASINDGLQLGATVITSPIPTPVPKVAKPSPAITSPSAKIPAITPAMFDSALSSLSLSKPSAIVINSPVSKPVPVVAKPSPAITSPTIPAILNSTLSNLSLFNPLDKTTLINFYTTKAKDSLGRGLLDMWKTLEEGKSDKPMDWLFPIISDTAGKFKLSMQDFFEFRENPTILTLVNGSFLATLKYLGLEYIDAGKVIVENTQATPERLATVPKLEVIMASLHHFGFYDQAKAIYKYLKQTQVSQVGSLVSLPGKI